MGGQLYRFEAVFTNLAVVGFVPEGLRLNAHFEGRVTSGRLAGATLLGVDYLRFRTDGVGVLDVRELITRDGNTVDVQVGGYLMPPAGFALPPAQVLLDPAFVWPEIELAVYGFAMFQTSVEEWSDLNRTVATFNGIANPGAGTLVVEADALVPQAVAVAVG